MSPTTTTNTTTTVPTRGTTPAFFSVAPSTWAPVVGSPFEVTLTALNEADSVDVGYTRPRCVTFTGPNNAPDGSAPDYPAVGDCVSGSSVVFNDGLATVNVTLVDPERAELKVTDNSTGTQGASSPMAVGELATTTTSSEVTGTSAPTATSIASSTTSAASPASTATTTGSATTATATTATATATTMATAMTATATTATATTATATTVPTTGTFSVVPAIWAPEVGSQFEVTLTALNGADSVDVGYTGPRCVTFTGPDNAPDGSAPDYPAVGDCASGSSVVFNDGLATVNVTLVDPERAQLKVTDNSVGTFGTCTVLVLPEPARP